MPYHYTHCRFGRALLPALPEAQRRCVSRFRRMYDMGLQGPDIFYYHSPFRKTPQGSLGEKIHALSGQVFFSAAWAAAGTEAAQAYLLGLLAHYCLDSLCHPYIDRLAARKAVRHIALESEWDRTLLQQDGIPEPHTYDMSRHFHLTREECMGVAAFYPGATPEGIRSSIRSMAFAARFFARGRRETRLWLLKRLKPEFCDFFLPTREVEDMRLYVRDLSSVYDQALKTYPLLLAEFLDRKGKNLSAAFAPIFG